MALAVLPTVALSQAASPTSSVELYGRLDASVNRQSYSATPTQPSQSATFVSSDTSFIGLRGREVMGGGFSTYFKIEHGFNVDTGMPSSASAFWNRESLVGLRHPTYGSLQLGSQYMPAISVTSKTDPFRRANTGAIFTLFQQGGAAGVAGPRGYVPQVNNAVQYFSPDMSGFTARLLVAATEGVAPGGRPMSMSVEYTKDRIYLGATWDRVKVAGSAVGQPGVAAVDNSSMMIGGTYRLDRFKLHGLYIKNSIDGTTGMTGTMLGASVPLGSGEVQATIQRRNVQDAANSDAQLVALQYAHFASKRTTLYAGLGRQRNDGGARFGVWPSRVEATTMGLPAAGSDVTSYQLGIRHLF